MKLQPNIYITEFRILWLIVILLLSLPVSAQKKKERLRIGAMYTKTMDGPIYLDLSTSARIERKNVEIPDIVLEVYYEVDGEEFALGEIQTGPEGKARFTFENLDKIQPDSTGLYILGASFGGNDTFRRASRIVEFRDAAIHASLQEQDSLNYITATLTDVALDSLVEEALIHVQVKRMFKPLRISEEFLMTDTDGSILVAVPKDIPGQDGMLEIEVVLEENDIYGIVKTSVEAQVGISVAHHSSYDQRTAWARRGRTPIFILIFTGVLIMGSWGFIVYLLFNMYKIAKN